MLQILGNLFRPSLETRPDYLQVGSRSVSLLFVQNHRAKRYLLRLKPDGTARVTIPRRGSLATAKEFVSKHIGWLEQQIHRLESQPKPGPAWRLGADIFLRGELVKIKLENCGQIRVGTELIEISDGADDLRPTIEKYLRKLAANELPARVKELAIKHGIDISRITIRNQKSRWGSCSRSGTISLNWRLIQVSDFVRDYIILHELAHRRHMNHSVRFWQEVERLCPDYLAAERWLKSNRLTLR